MRQTLTLNNKRGVYSRRSLALGLTYHKLSLKRKHDISILVSTDTGLTCLNEVTAEIIRLMYM